MAGTRATRGATSPDVEELRFDFTGASDETRHPLGPPSSDAAQPPERFDQPVAVAVSAPRLAVVASEPGLRAGSVSDSALSIGDFYNHVRYALFAKPFPTRSG